MRKGAKRKVASQKQAEKEAKASSSSQENQKENHKPAPKAKRVKTSKPEPEPEYFEDKRNLVSSFKFPRIVLSDAFFSLESKFQCFCL